MTLPRCRAMVTVPLRRGSTGSSECSFISTREPSARRSTALAPRPVRTGWAAATVSSACDGHQPRPRRAEQVAVDAARRSSVPLGRDEQPVEHARVDRDRGHRPPPQPRLPSAASRSIRPWRAAARGRVAGPPQRPVGSRHSSRTWSSNSSRRAAGSCPGGRRDHARRTRSQPLTTPRLSSTVSAGPVGSRNLRQTRSPTVPCLGGRRLASRAPPRRRSSLLFLSCLVDAHDDALPSVDSSVWRRRRARCNVTATVPQEMPSSRPISRLE